MQSIIFYWLDQQKEFDHLNYRFIIGGGGVKLGSAWEGEGTEAGELGGRSSELRSSVRVWCLLYILKMELKDPGKNRKVNTTPMPYQRSLSQDQLFPNDIVDYKILLKFYKREGKLSKKLYLELLKRAKHIFKEESNVVKIQDPITIVGDIHGQFYDFIKIIDDDTGGPLDSTKYIFLGDYVDRGCFSIQVLGLILAVKIRFKDTVFLLRGNHECRQLTSFFNFRTECLAKYDQETYDTVMELFDQLPLSAIINNKFLCIHGGISGDIGSLADIEKIDRTKQIPKTGLFCDLMWADPVDNDTGKLDGLTKNNDARGCSYYFGYELAKNFLNKNGLLSVIRAHEAQANGFKMYHWGGQKQFPTVITIFSAPNYCDFYNNKGAVIKFKVQSDPNSEQHAGHPAISLEPASVPAAKLHGRFRVEHPVRGREDIRDAVPPGKAGSQVR